MEGAIPHDQKSFADMVANSYASTRRISSHGGVPLIFIPQPNILAASIEFKNALVGRFELGCPKIDFTRSSIASFGLRDDYSTTPLHRYHILLRFVSEEDFVRVWTKGVWFINKIPMLVFKWTPSFRDLPLQVKPMWIGFPNLPLYMYEKSLLYDLAEIIGSYINMDDINFKRSRLNLAHVGGAVHGFSISHHPDSICLEPEGQPPFGIDVLYEEDPTPDLGSRRKVPNWKGPEVSRGNVQAPKPK